MRLIDADNLKEVLQRMVDDWKDGDVYDRIGAKQAECFIKIIDIAPTINVVIPETDMSGYIGGKNYEGD